MIAMVVAASALPSCATEGRPEGFDAAAREARLNRQSSRNAVFHHQLRRELTADFRRLVRRCRLESLDTKEVTLLYRLDASGDPVESMFYPPGAFAECVHEGIGGIELPPPPRPDYWFGVVIEKCPLGRAFSECPQLVP
jgi:hypothetical protein